MKVSCCAEMSTSCFGAQNQQERAWLCNLGGKGIFRGGVLNRALGHRLDNLQLPHFVLIYMNLLHFDKAAFGQLFGFLLVL